MRATSVILFSSLLCVYFSAEAQENSYPQTKNANFGTHRDTVRALTHLFQRKRKGTRVKAAVIGVLADVVIIKTWPHQQARPQGAPPPIGPAPQTPVASSSAVPTIYYVFVGLSTVLCVEMISQLRYGEKKLTSLLDEYDAGKPIPQRIKSKLIPSDFD